jgi:hypothetical protein
MVKLANQGRNIGERIRNMGETMIGSSVGGGHETGGACAWFFPPLCTYAI